MRNFLITALFISQISASLWLIREEGAVSGVAFFIISMIFIGLLTSIYDTVSGFFRKR